MRLQPTNVKRNVTEHSMKIFKVINANQMLRNIFRLTLKSNLRQFYSLGGRAYSNCKNVNPHSYCFFFLFEFSIFLAQFFWARI